MAVVERATVGILGDLRNQAQRQVGSRSSFPVVDSVSGQCLQNNRALMQMVVGRVAYSRAGQAYKVRSVVGERRMAKCDLNCVEGNWLR